MFFCIKPLQFAIKISRNYNVCQISQIKKLTTRTNSNTMLECNDIGIRTVLERDLILIEDFINEKEEESILSEIEPYVKKLRYEYDHWDQAIHGYRETERLNWNEQNQKIMARVKELAFNKDETLAHIHILDLHENGYIKPHVDAIRFCGNCIAGLSLLTDCVMRFRMATEKKRFAQAYLKRRSLYIIKDKARYDFTHEILKNGEAFFGGHPVLKTRRLSVICRNKPLDTI